MIKVKNLTKVYQSKKSDTCTALKNLTFSFADSGFVFIIGKSGSGKSTLLSILGGLDNATSGEIYVNGNNLQNFSDGDYVNFRNGEVGFIFQDYHLIDEISIFDNISLSLELQGEKDAQAVLDALKAVDLEGYENRFPRELSGGQKQRVAIARAIVKRPKLILADEPTGNLDSKTTKQVLNLLKDLSKDTLVVIVSHNLEDAETYADRILELDEGRIINNLVRNPDHDETVRIKGQNLVLPFKKLPTEEENQFIKENLQKGTIKEITFDKDIFKVHQGDVKSLDKPHKLEYKHLTKKSTMRLAFSFINSKWARIALYALVVASLIVVLSLCQLVVTFNSNEIIKQELGEEQGNTTISLIKQTLLEADYTPDDNYIYPIEDGDIQGFYTNGYTGEIYPLVYVSINLNGIGDQFLQYSRKPKYDLQLLFPASSSGVLVCDGQFVEKVFGTLKFDAIANVQQAHGFYITDYLADSIIATHVLLHGCSYHALLGEYYSIDGNLMGYINGVIDTGYQEEYADLRQALIDSASDEDALLEVVETEEYQKYTEDILQYLSISYTFNPDFVRDFVDNRARTITYASNFTLSVEQGQTERTVTYRQGSNNVSRASRFGLPISGNEVVMSIDTYNALFNTTYTMTNYTTFVPHQVRLTYFRNNDVDQEEALFTLNLNIVAITPYFFNQETAIPIEGMLVSDQIFDILEEHNIFAYGLYFDDIAQMSIITDGADEFGYQLNSPISLALVTMTKAVSVFADFFALILTVLLACIVLVLVNYGIKAIKEKMYEIGIIKALGGRTRDLVIIFGLQVAFMALFVIIFYTIGSHFFIQLANDVLVASLMRLASNNYMMQLQFLANKPPLMLLNIGIALVLVALSFLVPIIYLKSIKPNNIIKAKE